MKEEILKFWKGDAEDSEGTLLTYSHDASLLEVRPKLVLFPKDSDDVKNLVKWVSENKEKNKEKYGEISITPRCAGTDMSGAAIGESIILDFTRYVNRLIGGPLPIENALEGNKRGKKRKYDHEGTYPLVPSYITVEPGMLYRDFEKIAAAKGLILPCYTSSKNMNAIGGMFGNNSAGERTLKYGQTVDYVLSSKIVLSDGNEYEVKPLGRGDLEKKMAQGDCEGNLYKNIFELIRKNEEDIKHARPHVSKNSAGYYIWNVQRKGSDQGPRTGSEVEGYIFDLNKMLVGSQGTLGIVTEITLKIIPENRHSRLVAVSMDDLAPLGRLVDDLLTLDPETLETYDDKTARLAVRFFRDFLKHKGFVEAMRFLWSFRSEFSILIRNFFGAKETFPKMVILVEFAGQSDQELDDRCERLKEKIKGYDLRIHVTESKAEANKYWGIRRESFALLKKHVKGMRTAPFIDDIIVRPEFLPKFIPELNGILSKYRSRLVFTLAGHAGDGNFHIIPLMDFKRKDTAKTILEAGEEVFDLVMKYHGSLAAEHNDGLIRTPYLPKMYGEKMVEVFRKIKDVFDPENIFNPGKKVPTAHLGGTKEYIASHVAEDHPVRAHKV